MDEKAAVQRMNLLIPVYTEAESWELAKEAGFGMEEEGIPYNLIESLDPFGEALAASQRPGLGVALGISQTEGIGLFGRILKESLPVFLVKEPSRMQARILGKNGARIIKKSPFVDWEDTDV